MALSKLFYQELSGYNFTLTPLFQLGCTGRRWVLIALGELVTFSEKRLSRRLIQAQSDSDELIRL